MDRERYEITYYVKNKSMPNGLETRQYYTDDRALAIAKAKILKDKLGYFPVVVYDNRIQEWVEID